MRLIGTMNVSHTFDVHTIPANGVGGRCHILRENERNALLEYFVKSLPHCYITQATLRDRVKVTGHAAGFHLGNKLPDPGSVMSGDFGEILTLFFLGSERNEKVELIKKWLYKQDRKKPAPHSDVLIVYREFSDRASVNDFVISAESKQKATKTAFDPITAAVVGLKQDQTGRLARTLAWLREKAIDHGAKEEVSLIERFTHQLSVTYRKHYKAVAIVDRGLLDGELARQPAATTDGSFEIVVLGIKDLKEFYEQVFSRAVKEVTI
jgi:hypothetical protein